MKAMEDKILQEGQVISADVLKVGDFLNYRIDTRFINDCAKEIVRLFSDKKIDVVLTIESSGVALAFATASLLDVPMVFAKKSKTSNVNDDLYHAKVHSFTHGTDNDVIVNRKHIRPGDRVLIVDDFLAAGNAFNGLISIVEQAGAEPVGVAAAIEKGFQGGGDALRAKGIRVESLAIVDRMEKGKIVFRPQPHHDM